MKKLQNLYYSLALGLLLLPGLSFAQPGTNMPDLLECGQQGNIEIICGTRSPEDFEVTPDGKYLIVAKYGQGDGAPLDLYEIATGKFTALPLSTDPQANWGESTCTESKSIGQQVSPHGLSLSRRSGGEWQFYVVNHSVRESMEMYELLPRDNSWKLVWRGCVLADKPYNDVSTSADGSFVATRPQAIDGGANIFGGHVTGNVARWSKANGETVLPDSEYGYPNGVLISEDGDFAYISAWTTQSFHKYDLNTNQEVASVEFSFMPDNLTWTPDGKILAAGINGVSGNCPEDSDVSCIIGFGVVEIDPETMATETVYDSGDKELISGTSVAIETAGYIYVGSFQGSRLVKIPR